MLDYINPMSVPGYTSHAQMKIIEAVCKSIPSDSRILEIGCALGRSTVGWLNCINDTHNLDVMDTFTQQSEFTIPSIINHSPGWGPTTPADIQTYDEIIDYFKSHTHKETWDIVVKRHSNYKNIKNVYSSKLQDFMKENSTQPHWDVVYLDALDETEEVISALNYFEGAELICGDDYNTSRHVNTTIGVHRFLEKKLLEQNEWALYTFPHCSFFCLTKKYSQVSSQLQKNAYVIHR